MFSVLKSGGILMIPIVLCGIFATFIIIERIIYFISLKKKSVLFREKIAEPLKLKNYGEVLEICKSEDIPEAAVIGKAVYFRNTPISVQKDAVNAEIDKQVPKLEKFLTSLGTIANISTLLGLLGTVTGNISAFGVLGEGASMGNPALLAGSIAEALVTTASGLVISIPALIFHNYFVAKVDKTLSEMETSITELQLQFLKKED
ncbi:MAG: MotA/TolQ/ExbB proton channel family protein [Spirochaetaceae bacterium]|nr:MotA/TolQ/ExbB proton channel family protein [Spirochaetaceae bacterium]MBQ4554614.1 MotA/TolQ/ExbB proton channel family protein [Spirochaetaceae bacterium]MBQ8353690.1 MotA/TolQ/ExbB proton channel family protein [Spirochaetaceae bacterium]